MEVRRETCKTLSLRITESTFPELDTAAWNAAGTIRPRPLRNCQPVIEEGIPKHTLVGANRFPLPRPVRQIPAHHSGGRRYRNTFPDRAAELPRWNP